VEGDGWQRREVVHTGGCRVSQSCDGIVSVPWVLGLVQSRTPVEIEEEICLGGDLL